MSAIKHSRKNKLKQTERRHSCPLLSLTRTRVSALRLISVKVYHSMIEKKILTADDKVELLNGIIYEKYTGRRYLISAQMYNRIIEAKIFDENDNVELNNGELIEKIPNQNFPSNQRCKL